VSEIGDQTGAQKLENAIAHQMTIGIVYSLEIIDISTIKLRESRACGLNELRVNTIPKRADY